MKKEKIITQLKGIKIPNLLSLSIIGSSQFKDELNKVEDIDIYLILEKLDVKTYNCIINEFEKITKELSTKETKFIVEMRAGSFKPHYDNRINQIQFHVIINTLETLSKKSGMVSLDWKLNNYLISGKPVSKYLKILKFSKEELINGNDGLKFFLNLLNEGTKSYKLWVIEENSLNRITKTSKLEEDEDWFELIQFVILQGFVNTIRLENTMFLKDESEIIKESKKRLPEKYQKLIAQILSSKKKLREEGILNVDMIRLKSEAEDFIKYLIKMIE